MSNQSLNQNKTVAAISTAFGKGGIAVIRISGDDAITIAEKMFIPKSKKRLSELPHANAVWGDILKDGAVIDDGMATVFFSPHSFTGENTVEISCHGGILLTQNVLESAFLCGAFAAGPGEFTRRAFINGKLSLTQAEAIGMLLDATTDEQIRLAAASSRGVLDRRCNAIAEELRAILSSTYAYIDFPDEDLEDLSVEEIKSRLSALLSELRTIEDSYHSTHAVNEGLNAVIIGRPNVGKSTFMNLLAEKDLAIVTEIPGTTRDVISQNITLGKVLLKLSDTAGIHSSEDKVEQIGIDRAKNALSKAELIFAVFDASEALTEEDIALLSLLDQASGVKIAVINKQDLPRRIQMDAIRSHFQNIAEISAKTRSEDKNKITQLIENLFLTGNIDYNTDAIVANARQYASIQKCHISVQNAMKALQNGYTQDIAGMDIENAYGAICEIEGRDISQDIVNEIFSKFCVGK